mmetsp:Transcript_94252/g.237655  ORF Transcript_94252/g.237655 Transcript_94252/m.237655 type:complete len:219 (-) Transcript_94252:953-1609(-)
MASLFGRTSTQDLSNRSQEPRKSQESTLFVGLLGAPFASASTPYLGGKASTCDTREVEMPSQVANWIRQLVYCPPKATDSTSSVKKLRRANELAQAAKLVSDFCEHYPALHIEPTPEALEELALSCSSLPRSAVAKAFNEQLSWSSGDMEWQPRLRALFALEYLCGQESRLSRTLVRKVVAEAQDILRHLVTEVPQCREKAAQVLALPQLSSHSIRAL